MDDVLVLVSHHLLLLSSDPSSLIAFVKLQAAHKGVWLRFKNDHILWRSLQARLPKWSLPPHMGLRRRVITGIKLLHNRCIACDGPATRVFMAFQARLCGGCCHRLLISDFELAWLHGVRPNALKTPYIVRYVGETRVLFFMRQHVRVGSRSVRPITRAEDMWCWPGVTRAGVSALLDRMG